MTEKKVEVAEEYEGEEADKELDELEEELK